MFCRSLLLSIIFCSYQRLGLAHHKEESGDSDYGIGLLASLRDDANLDLSVDEEYEDLRAELLAYQAALASVISRRSLWTTPCWQAGGICISYKLCKGAKYVTQIPGCRDKHNVCCFSWNRYYIKDYRDKGIPNTGYPWQSLAQEYGGKGIQHKAQKGTQKKNKKVKNKNQKKKNSQIST